MAAAAILKNPKTPYLAAVTAILTKFGRLMQFDPLDRPTVKNLTILKSTMVAAAILKN